VNKVRTYLKKGETISVSSKQAMDGILGLLGFEPDAMSVFELWDKETRGIVRGCEAVGLLGKRLVVRVPSSAHKQEIYYSKDRIVKNINQAMGRKAITDILFELSEDTGGVVRDKEVDRRWSRN
jgi:hypothetical protein